MQRYLVIGVGGSGGNSLRQTVRELERRLRAAGWRHGIPAAWKFLHIDVRQNADDLEGDIPIGLRDTDTHLGLGAWPFEYSHYDGLLTSSQSLLQATARWRPDPSEPYASPHAGAGQRRAVGRVITMTQLARVSTVLDGTIAAMFNNEAGTELDGLAAHLHADPFAGESAPARAIIISSLSGGAGSGSFLDIVQLLKARGTQQNQWLTRPLCILFAADIFQTLGPDERKGIEPNTLAAFSELLSAYEHRGPLDPTEAVITQMGGGAQPLVGNLAQPYTLVVGRRNGDLDLGTSSAVYGATGKALAAFISSPKVQRDFDAFLTATWTGPPLGLRISSGGTVHPTSSFGYGNVTLARGLLSQYAAERLSARSLRRLVKGHLEETSPGAFVREDDVKARRADERQKEFFEASGLWEVTKDHNQVLDAFRDESIKKAELDKVKDKVLKAIRGGDPAPAAGGRRGRKERENELKLRPSEWRDSFGNTFDVEAAAYILQEQQLINSRARDWVKTITDRLVRATQREIALGGIPVTLELLDRLRIQVGQAVQELKLADFQFREVKEPGFLAYANEAFNKILDRTIGPTHSVFDEAATHRRSALSRRTEAHLYSLTADILSDLNERCLLQLRQAVQGLLNTVLADMAQPATKVEVDQWSVGPVGRHLNPAPNEELLEPIATFPALLDDLLVATVGIEGEANALSAAVAEVISGTWPSADDPDPNAIQDPLIATPRFWAPRRSEGRTENQPSSVAQFSTSVAPLAILDRAQTWVRRRTGALSTTVAESLQSWLDPSHPDAASRAETFAQCFGRALKHVAPMVSINPTTLSAAHGVDHIGQHPIISLIPLAPDHRARGPVEQFLKAVRVPDARLPEYFDPNFTGGEVEIISFLGGCVHPIVFDSIFTPIGEDWLAKRNNPELCKQWWSWRRARPLSSFMPVSPDHQMAIVRGWLTASLLGQIPPLTGPWTTQPLTIWSPDGWQPFPPVLFTDISEPRLVLPAVCEALPLAVVSFANGNPRELRAYERLIDLGTRGAGGSVVGYPRINEELEQWVLTGKTRPAMPTFEAAPNPDPLMAGPADGEASDRADVIAARCDAGKKYAEQDLSQIPITAETSLTVDPMWELWRHYAKAFEQLGAAVREVGARHQVPETPRPWMG